MKKYITILIFSLLSLTLNGQSVSSPITWTGAVSGDWNDPDNWDLSTVPGELDTVIIDLIPMEGENPVLSDNVIITKLEMINGVLDLNEYEIQITNEANFLGGEINNGFVKCSGTMAHFEGTEFDSQVEVICLYFYLHGSVFHRESYFENSIEVGERIECNGSNVFYESVTIVHNSTGDLHMANYVGDTFYSYLILKNHSEANLCMSVSDRSTYNSITLENTNVGGILFGINDGITVLEYDAGIFVTEPEYFSFGILGLANIESVEGRALELELFGESALILDNCIFESELIFTAPDILYKNCTFKHNATLVKTGGYVNICEGGNIFMSSATIQNQSSEHALNLSNTLENKYEGPVFFESAEGEIITQSDALLEAGLELADSYYSDIYIQSDYVVLRNVILQGTSNQVLSGNSSHNYYQIEVNKPSGYVTAEIPINILNNFSFSSGIIHCDSINLITFYRYASASGASNASFVSGPVKKIGNTAFTFPVGKWEYYRPIAMTATSNSTNAYRAEYFNYPQPHGPARDTTLEFIAYCNFWNLSRITGTDPVAFTIGWEENHCGLYDSTLATVARWDSVWTNMHVANFDGTKEAGKITSEDSLDVASADVLIAYRLVPFISVPQNLEVTDISNTRSMDHFFGLNGANTIQPGPGWDDNTLRTSIAQLRPATMRFPGGELGNWWDWREGWFVDPTISFQSCTGFPTDYQLLTPKNNHLATFKEAIGVMGSRPLFMLNLLSSNIAYQLAMLHEAEILGMPVRQVELGNEFYKDVTQNCEYTEIFPDVTDYANASEDWILNIRNRFVNSTVAVIGADNNINFPSASRQNTWNDGMNVNAFSTGKQPDGVTIHPYYGSGLNLDDAPECYVIDYINISDPADMFEHTFDVVDALESNDYNPHLDPMPSWITEYNLFDGSKGFIHGSWAHALKTTSGTLALLEKDWIAGVNCFAMVGNATFGAFFSTNDGFLFSDDPQNPSNRFCSAKEEHSISTVTNSMTSLGFALQELGDAMRFAISASILDIGPLSGSQMPMIGSENGIYGWLFEDNIGNEQIIVMNLSDESITLEFNSSSLGTPEFMRLISLSGPGLPSNNVLNRFITNVDNSTVDFVQLNPNGMGATSSNIPATTYQVYDPQMEIPPHSIMRYTSFDITSPAVTISASDDSICAGHDFYLYANATPGSVEFNWKNNGSLIGTSTTPFFIATHTTTHNYTVDAVYPGSVTATSSNSVSVTEKEVPVLTATSNTQFCITDTPIELEASLSSNNPGPYYYCWIGAEGAEISSNESTHLTDKIEVMPQETSTYIVYATDGLCSVKKEILVEVIGKIDFVANPITYCSGGSTILDPNVSADSYLWDDGVTTFSSSTITVNPSSHQVYTLTVTDGLCVVTETIGVMPVECCNTTADVSFLFSDAPIVSTDDLMAAVDNICSTCVDFVDNVITGSPTTVYIEGELLIDENLDIHDVTFLFADRGSLVVDNAKLLRLYGCELTTCSNRMWQGVILKERGMLNTFQSTIISKAYHGIYANNKTKVGINNTTFEDNFIGIKSLGAPVAAMIDFTKSINRSYFQSVDPILPPYTNITTLPANSTTRGYAGIVAESDLYTLSSSVSGDYSQFENFSNGIVGSNSILNISNTLFRNIQPELEYNYLGKSGIGVSAIGNINGTGIASLSLTGLGIQNTDPLTFDYCVTAVYTEISSLRITETKINSVINGIKVSLPLFQPIVITNNIINADKTGIGLFTTDLSGHIDIRENKIEVNESTPSGNPTFGIGMFNVVYPYNWSVCRINCNEITLGTAQNGITISGFKPYFATSTLSVKDNHVQINDNSVTENGILFQDVTGAFLQHNNVAGSDPTDATFTNSYKFFNSPSNVISQNSSDGTKVGFQFEMSCNSMDNIRGNSMGDHFHGMELQANGFTGTQSYTGNTWGGYAGSQPFIYEEDPSDPGNFIGAWADQSLTIQDLSQSRFTVNSASTLVHFPDYTPVGTDWFKPDIGLNPTFSYADNCLVMPPLDPELRLGYADSLIVNDTITSPLYQEELRINAGLHLIDKLFLMLQNEDIPSFFANHLSGYSLTANGKIARYRDTLSVLSNIGTDSIDFIVINDSILHSRLTEISLLQDGDLSESDTIFEQANSMINSLSIVRKNAVEQLLTNIEAIVYDLMDGVTTSHIIESNLKDTYLSFYNLMMGEATLEIKSVLNPIANQCIFEGGPGVTIARNLLAAQDSSVIYDDNVLCGSSRIGQVINPGLNKSYKNITVYPNPSTGLFTVVIPKEFAGKKIVFSVYDLSGSLVYSLKNNGESGLISFDLSGFATGMYYLRVQADHTDYYQKLSIAR